MSSLTTQQKKRPAERPPGSSSSSGPEEEPPPSRKQRWVYTLGTHSVKKRPTISKTRKEKDEQRWNGMLEKLKEYRRIHFDCCVPRKWSSDPQLATWVHTQRQKKANNKLPSHHKQKLDAIKFQWSQRTNKLNDTTSATDTNWLKTYQELVTYYEEHGDCLVRQNGKKASITSTNDRVLAEWVSTQRKVYRAGKLKEERKKRLDELGFVYNFNKADPKNNASRTQKQWDVMFEHLEEFKKQYGHVDVKTSYIKWGLGQWVEWQRTQARKGTMDHRRAVRLQEIGITWRRSYNERWEDGFQMLVEYRKIHGHCWGSGGNQKLSSWVQCQRKSQATGKLLPERKERLDAIGFPWLCLTSSNGCDGDDDGDDTGDGITTSFDLQEHISSRPDCWEDGFAKIVEYQKKHGYGSVPRYSGSNERKVKKRRDNRKLSKWVRNQMFLEATDVILSERKERLDAIGFPFGSCDFYSDDEEDDASSKE